MTDAASHFLEEIRARIGYAPSDVVGDGKIHRFSTSKRGVDDAGWYVFYNGEFPAGISGDWRTGLKIAWSARETKELSPEEKSRFDEVKAERERKTAAAYVAAAAGAIARWNNAAVAQDDHAYLTAKKVHAHGIRQAHGCLVVPIYIDGEIVSIQTIDDKGDKLFAKESRTKGGHFVIGNPGPHIVIAEGYATGASIFEAAGLPVVIAFNAGNIVAVSKAIRAKHPRAAIIIAADDDFGTEAERGINPGISKAKEAAALVKGSILVPPFKRDDGDKGTDWNDFSDKYGQEEVARLFKSAIAKASVERLAGLDKLDYELTRKEAATSLDIRETALDSLVKQRRADAKEKAAIELCRDTVPWTDPVNAAGLLDDVRRTIHRFIVCDRTTATAATLWIAFTWIIDDVSVAPIAIITAPEKRCGKSQLLDLIGRLSRRSLYASNISPAATFRVIEAKAPTLIIDEADAFFRENEELRGIINSGHTRTSAYVIRTVGDDHEVKQFSTWGAKAIAGIGRLPETVMDRAVILTLRRKLPTEKVERIRHAEPGLFDILARKLARFGEEHGAAIGRIRPDMPEAMNDRAQDNWEPLFAIAELAGGDWSKEARRAALDLAGKKDDSSSTGEELLADIRAIFDADGCDRIAMAELLKRLCEDEMAPWGTWNRGKPMSTRQFGARLKEYGIKAKTVHIDHYDKPYGYSRAQFAEAWSRYLDEQTSDTHASDTPSPPLTRSPPHNTGDFQVSEPVSDESRSAHSFDDSPKSDEVNRHNSEQPSFAHSPVRSPEKHKQTGLGERVSGQTPVPDARVSPATGKMRVFEI